MDVGDLDRRCPKLGHQLTFAYCQTEAGDRPCLRVVPCWDDRFEVVAWVKATIPSHEWDKYLEPLIPNKAGSLLDLIAKAKENIKPKGH